VVHLRRFAFVSLAGAVLAVTLAGCGKKASSVPSSGPAVAAASPAPAGPGGGGSVFDQNCAKCHALGSDSGGGRGKGKGPDLSAVGADPAHTPAWIAEHIRNPKAHKPQSRMPSFDGKLSDDEIRKLADDLAARK
jgi:mono/diheme cytochrome c family protein